MQRVLKHILDIAVNCNGFQIFGLKCSGFYGLNAFPDRELVQLGAVSKRVAFNPFNAVGNIDACQLITVSERFASDGYDAVWNGDALDIIAICEGISRYVFYAMRNINRGLAAFISNKNASPTMINSPVCALIQGVFSNANVSISLMPFGMLGKYAFESEKAAMPIYTRLFGSVAFNSCAP